MWIKKYGSYTETLFSKDGQWFLEGQGGPGSPYELQDLHGQPSGQPGKKTIPITPEEAHRWAVHNGILTAIEATK